MSESVEIFGSEYEQLVIKFCGYTKRDFIILISSDTLPEVIDKLNAGILDINKITTIEQKRTIAFKLTQVMQLSNDNSKVIESCEKLIGLLGVVVDFHTIARKSGRMGHRPVRKNWNEA